MASSLEALQQAKTERPSPVQKIRKRRLCDFPAELWSKSPSASGDKVIEVLSEPDDELKPQSGGPDLTSLAISNHDTCNTCNVAFISHIELRLHVQSDHHKLNLRRKLKRKPPLNEAEFENAVACLSDGSLSGSEEDDSDTDDTSASARKGNSGTQSSVKLQFKDPSVAEGYIIVYKVALPDESTLRSLSNLGSWAVVMSGGGHFSAAVWGTDGETLKHKSFHRYTTRRKQGGSQAIADAGSGGSRIKSAGANLRRYGEQALRQDVHQLLMSWKDELLNVQCVFIRASKRDKKDLLFGWEGSPLADARDKGICRIIPFPTRRATLKEVTRVYDQLSTAIVSPRSLIEPVGQKNEEKPASKPSKLAAVVKPAPNSKVPVEKGTAHLKKRETKKVETKVERHESIVQLRGDYLQLIQDVATNSLAEVQLRLRMNPELGNVEFGPEYFKEHEKLEDLTRGYGVIGVAAACGALDVLEWLMLEKFPLQIGGSPYTVTKAKRIRTFLRTFWGKHPDLHDYAAAGIPSPLTDAELAASAEKEREKRRREKEKRKEKAFLAAEAAKPPAVRARELRAAAAEARLLGNRCAVCKKFLEGIVPFERLTYKYCSLDHCQKHREVLAKQ